MTTTQHKLLRARAALALREELGRRPTDAELQLLLRVIEKAVAGLRMFMQEGGAC